MDYFQPKIEQWADWQAVQQNATVFEALIKQIYSSENEPFKTPEPAPDNYAAVFTVGPTQIAIFPPSQVAADTRDRYQTERFSLTRMARLHLTAPRLLHAGFIFDTAQFYYVIYRPLQGVSLATFAQTAEPLAKATLGRQIGTALNQLDGEVAPFNQVDSRQLSTMADWESIAAGFTTERERFLAEQPVDATAFVHGNLNGENLVVTSGQVGFQHFSSALRAPRQVELVPLILEAFAGDRDFLAGLQATLAVDNLLNDLLVGLLWRQDGPLQIKKLMGSTTVTIPALQQRLAMLLNIR